MNPPTPGAPTYRSCLPTREKQARSQSPSVVEPPVVSLPGPAGPPVTLPVGAWHSASLQAHILFLTGNSIWGLAGYELWNDKCRGKKIATYVYACSPAPQVEHHSIHFENVRGVLGEHEPGPKDTRNITALLLYTQTIVASHTTNPAQRVNRCMLPKDTHTDLLSAKVLKATLTAL